MGAEGRLGAKKHRRAEAAVGETLHMAIATHSGWVICVTPDDRHFAWRPKTGEVELEDDDGLHWTSCPKGPTPGPPTLASG